MLINIPASFDLALVSLMATSGAPDYPTFLDGGRQTGEVYCYCHGIWNLTLTVIGSVIDSPPNRVVWESIE